MRFLLRYGADRRAPRFRERQELVKAGLTRRDLVKMGLLTGGGVGGGLLFADKSLADGGQASASLPPLDAVRPAAAGPAELLPRARRGLPDRRRRSPRTGRRTRPPACRSRAGRRRTSPRTLPGRAVLPDPDGRQPEVAGPPGPPGADVLGVQPRRRGPRRAIRRMSPGPVLVMRYGTAALVRRHNAAAAARAERRVRRARGLDPPAQLPLRRPTATAGRATRCSSGSSSAGSTTTTSTTCASPGGTRRTRPTANIQEALGFLWYHDHRVDHTAENTYKGLVGPAIVVQRVRHRRRVAPASTCRASRTSTSRSCSPTS